MAEDDDEDELLGATTPSPSSATQPPASDFEQRLHQQQGGALEMAKPSQLAQQSYPETTSPSTEPSRTDPETTAGPAPTEAPDPDAMVCSGRPFDSFMQVKNGSIFAFRGQSHTDAFSDLFRASTYIALFSFLRGIFF